MTVKKVKLIEHLSISPYTVTACYRRQGECLELSFNIEGDMSSIVFPELKNRPIRQHNLWQHTCFEVFLQSPMSKNYLELNLSPHGPWQCYEFSSYRKNRAESLKVISVRSQNFQGKNSYRCSFALNFFEEGILLYTQIKPACVLKSKQQLTYWSTEHSSTKPDFHAPCGYQAL